MAVRPPLLRPVSQSANLTSVFLGLLYGLENLPRAFVVTIIAYDVLRLMGQHVRERQAASLQGRSRLRKAAMMGRLMRSRAPVAEAPQ
ncbi:MAG: hypothetical protein VXX01_11105, partial [Pseudomonadota bacterium]|nr:hypothetical protein [Pseudomonadota bacterium]